MSVRRCPMTRLGLLATISVGSVHAQSAPVGPDGWRRDLEFVVAGIKAVHPRPFHRVLEASFDSAAAAVGVALPRLSDEEATVALMGLVALVHDGHTRLAPRAIMAPDNRWFPLRIDRFVDGIFVVATDSAHRNLLGAEVLRLGDRRAADAWAAAERVSAGDNRFSKMAGVPLLLMMPEVVTGLGLGTRNGLRLEVRLGGRSRVETIPAITAQAGVDALLGRAVPGGRSIALPTAATRDLVFQRRDDGYWLRQERESGLLYAQIDQVFDDGNPVHLDQDTARLSLREFGQAVLARIDSGQVRTLVLDLRNNPGGNNGLIVPLVAGLAARPAINQRGRLFVITGRATYSAAMNFVSLLEDRTEAIFVGEPPGGSPSHYGDATTFSLPASGLDLYVSTLHWNTGVRPTDVREEQEPELAIAPRFADLVAGRDSAMAAVRAWQSGASLSERLLALFRSGGLERAAQAARAEVAARGQDHWSSVVQQLERFAYAVLSSGGSGPDIYGAFGLVTELYPESAEAWFTLGRINFGRRPREAADAFARALALRPGHELIRRMEAAARRQAAPTTRSPR